MKKLTLITAIILSIAFLCQDAQSQNQDKGISKELNLTNLNPQNANMPHYLDNAITIKLKEGVGDFNKQSGTVSFGIQTLDEKINQFEVYTLEKRFRYNPNKLRKGLPDLSRIYKITFPEKYSISKVAGEFASDLNIEYAEFIPLNYPDDIPDDAMYDQCQHLPQIFAPEAWDIFHGEDGPEIVIAIIDNGVYWKHVDLTENIWQNLGEDFDGDGKTLEFIGGEWVFDPDDENGVDDDGNGFTDDFIGWDIIANNNDPDHNSGEDHGTHCSGIAAGVTNNGEGIASISWNVKTMPVQVSTPAGTFNGAYDGIIYAAENGADFISNSWGSTSYSIANQEVIDYVTGLGSVMVASAGNNNTIIDHYPSDYIGVVSVASVSVDDTKAGYSSYGPAVDISAPGGGWEGGILSTVPYNNYGLMSGTSMACPLVAGCFGLLKSYHPDWTNEQLITQILGTGDDINSINPDYENLLGTGRVNALSFLAEENVIMPQILKLELVSMGYADANGNQVNEPGEEVTLNFEFRNFVPFVGDDDVIVSLSTDDPEITILDGSATVAIPPDGLFTIEDQFQFLVSEEATPHMAIFTISFESEFEITWGQEHDIEVLVAPDGVFIFEGVENDPGYSGTYIKEILDQLGIHNIYSNTYPPTLLGFETVFVSHGNFGETLSDGTMFTEQQSLMFQEFLENGGNMFVDMGSMFGAIDYFGYSNAGEMKSLFGVQSNITNMVSNPIDSLYGMTGSIMEGIHFTQTNQIDTWYIDDLVLADAVATFTEQNYGIVSAMNDGASTYGHKTFYLCYSLGELIDIDPINSKNNVLLKVLNFFELLSEGYLLSGFSADKYVGGPPLEIQFSDYSLSDPSHPILSWEWDFNSDGVIDSQEQNPSWTFSDTGEHDITLITTNDMLSDTLTKYGFITVNHGYLVYEGKPDGEGYSGTFIKNYMEDNNYFSVTYRNELPEDLNGYWAVFLSFGNYDSENTILDDHMANIIIKYLNNGGFVYLEGGDSFGYDQPGNSELLGLFGLQSAVDGITNPIDSLGGQPDALTSGMLFTATSQQAQTYIDLYEPVEEATVAFNESDYGTVAVQYTGEEYNQRTFCFSYTLADLDDGEVPNTRAELISRICNFFDIYTTVYSPVEKKIELEIYPNPTKSESIIRYYLPEESVVSIDIFEITGKLIKNLVNRVQPKGNKYVPLNISALPEGIYLLRLNTGNQTVTKKIIKVK